jgi:hypothetical protein
MVICPRTVLDSVNTGTKFFAYSISIEMFAEKMLASDIFINRAVLSAER